MGISGRGPKIKVQDVEERTKSDSCSEPETFMAFAHTVGPDLRPLAEWGSRARNLGLSEGVTQGESKKDRGAPKWLKKIVPFVDAIWRR